MILTLQLIISMAMFLLRCIAAKPNYCLPADICWPSPTETNALSSSLDGQLVTALSNPSLYASYVDMTRDKLFLAYPAFVVVCLSAQDIQRAVTFASWHNIQISICSTGHSYSGRNTANYSVQINLSKMAKYKVAADASTITVETGMHWAEIYEIVDSVNRIVVGGSDPDVGPAGFSLGGGHSPISPHYGLSSDFTTGYYLVDAHSNIVDVYNTSGKNQTIDDLFWSLKGGGGSTFGVVINITFALHIPQQPLSANKFTHVTCLYNFYQHPLSKQGFMADYILQNYFDLVRTNELDANWGGYLLSYFDDEFVLSVLFYGNVSYAKQNGQLVTMLSYPYNNSVNTICSMDVYDTFWGYESTVPPMAPSVVWVFNSLVAKNNLTNEYVQDLTAFLNSSINSTEFGCGITLILQGGKVNERDDDFTAVTPAFRHNWFEASGGCGWSNQTYAQMAIDNANKYETKLREYGLGIYSNEEAPECFDADWKQQFWGNHYEKLLNVKKKWDPNQVFWCNHCVGSD